MSTWSKADAIAEFEYPLVGDDLSRKSAESHNSKAVSEEAALRREAYARQLGRQEGETAARGDYEEAIKQERKLLLQALGEFRAERERYFGSVEREVVELALAIARKLLQREAHFDPLLLRAAVRVALDKLQEETQVTLRVASMLADQWRSFVAENKDLVDRVEVLADDGIAEDACAIETSVGSAELGVEAQLKEIEQGFFDLLARRPRSRG